MKSRERLGHIRRSVCTHDAVGSLATHSREDLRYHEVGVLRMQAIAYATKYGWIYYFDALELVVVYHLSVIS